MVLLFRAFCIAVAGLVFVPYTGVAAPDHAPVTARHRNDHPLQVDGMLTESAWTTAPAYALRHSVSGAAAPVRTTFRVLYDADALYFGVVCEHPPGIPPRAQRTERDSGVWNDDCIELFLDPTGRGEEYYQFVVNALGTVYDSRYFTGKNGDSTWDAADMTAAASCVAGRWSVELRLPFSDVLVPVAPALNKTAVSAAAWRFNLAREYKGGKPNLLTFQALSNFFDTASYARLAGLDIDYAAFRWRLGPLVLNKVEPHPQGYRLALSAAVENRTGKFRVFSLTGNARLPGGTRRGVDIAPIYGADHGQTQILPFSVTVGQAGELRMDLRLADRRRGNVVAHRTLNLTVDISPLRLAITRPSYRSAIYATMDVRTVEVELTALWRPERRDGDVLDLILTAPTGERIAARTMRARESFFGRHDIPIPKLAPGDYVCEARLQRDGNTLHTARTVLHVYAPSPSEVRVNDHLNFVINGRETFLVGFFHNPWGRPIGEYCNAAITYGMARDLETTPSFGETLTRLGEQGRNLMLFPHPKDLWTHQVGGRNELARKPLPPEHAARIGARVAQYQRQPGLLGWYMADEPSPHMFLPTYLEQLATVIRKHDPYHPAYLSFNNGSTAKAYEHALDACGVHWYCMFRESGPEFPLATIAEHVENAKRALGNSKAIVVSPQLIMYAHSGVKRPVTHLETRCMAYLGIVHGAKGVVWFSTGGLRSSLEIRLGMPVMAAELRALEPVFLAHDGVDLEVSGPQSMAIHTMAKDVDGELYAIAVNATPKRVSAGLRTPPAWRDIPRLRLLAATGNDVECRDGGVTLTFAPYQVHLLTTDSAGPDLTSMEELKARFAAQERQFVNAGNLCYTGTGATLSVSLGFGDLGAARTLIDGYRDYCGEGSRAAAKGSWAQITFVVPAPVLRIEVSSNDESKRWRGPGHCDAYELELRQGDEWLPVDAVVTATTNQDADVYTRIHTLPVPQLAAALRLRMSAGMKRAGVINEIQAFSSTGAEK